jgi:hypothetical protein
MGRIMFVPGTGEAEWDKQQKGKRKKMIFHKGSFWFKMDKDRWKNGKMKKWDDE